MNHSCENKKKPSFQYLLTQRLITEAGDDKQPNVYKGSLIKILLNSKQKQNAEYKILIF